jgi:hypothetical protein
MKRSSTLSKYSRNGRNDGREHDAFMNRLIQTLDAIKDGDFSSRFPSDWIGLEGRVADHLNAMSSRLERFNAGLLNLRRMVGQDGKINARLSLGDSIGG